MNISVASDHAGFDFKKQVVDYLVARGHTVLDRGPDSDARVDYPDYAAKVVADVSADVAERGILICGTGIGMAITANRFPGIRAANVTTPEFASLAREHNDANILCLSARFVDGSVNESIIDAFLDTQFGEGRHTGRILKIEQVSGILNESDAL